MKVYLLNLSQNTVTFIVTNPDTGNSQTYTLSPQQYADISSLVSGQTGEGNINVKIKTSCGLTANISLSPTCVQTIVFNCNTFNIEPVSPEQILQNQQSSSGSQSESTASPLYLSRSQVLAQIQAGDIDSLQSELAEIPPDMIPLVNAVTQLYRIYDEPNGTPLSSIVERLLSDLRNAYFQISNHKQEEVNIQQLIQLIKIYNTLANNGLAPISQSAIKLKKLIQTSETTPALPPVIGQTYPGRIYDNGMLGFLV